MQITIIGAGAWGTALAIAASRQSPAHRVSLHARDAAQAEAMQRERCNARYLPGIAFPQPLAITSGPLDAMLQMARPEDLFIIATPMAGLRSTLQALQGASASVAWLCKGFEADTGLMPHEVQAQVAPQLLAGALNGPSFAQEVARTQPTALVAASGVGALATGLQEMTKSYAAETKTVVETMQAEIKELASVKSPAEFFEKQNAMMRKQFDAAVAATSKNSEAMLKLASEAFQPISNRVSLAVEKIKHAA